MSTESCGDTLASVAPSCDSIVATLGAWGKQALAGQTTGFLPTYVSSRTIRKQCGSNRVDFDLVIMH